jgi:hypothetical protein
MREGDADPLRSGRRQMPEQCQATPAERCGITVSPAAGRVRGDVDLLRDRHQVALALEPREQAAQTGGQRLGLVRLAEK